MAAFTIIADDLTGAADCGIAFAAAGLPTFVAFSENAETPRHARVVAVDTDSRWRSPEEARAKVETAARRAYADGARSLYKKIDSTLRGHVAIELNGLLRVGAEILDAPPLVIVAPAFPATGRIVRDGRVFVNGTPLEDTEIWRHAGMTGVADLSALLRAQGFKTAPAGLALLRADAASVIRSLREWADAGVQALVCDAEDEEDLRRIAEASTHLARPILWVGSAGLAHHLARVLDLGLADVTTGRDVTATGPILIAVGSMSKVARAQLEAVAAAPGVARVRLSPSTLLDGAASPEWGRLAARSASLLADGHDLALAIDDGKTDTTSSLRLAGAFGRFVAGLVGRSANVATIHGIVATGGDTARAILEALGTGGLWLVREVEPGVPIGVTDTHPPIAVVTKAGAFGGPQTLVRCREALAKRGAPHHPLDSLGAPAARP